MTLLILAGQLICALAACWTVYGIGWMVRELFREAKQEAIDQDRRQAAAERQVQEWNR